MVRRCQRVGVSVSWRSRLQTIRYKDMHLWNVSMAKRCIDDVVFSGRDKPFLLSECVEGFHSYSDPHQYKKTRIVMSYLRKKPKMYLIQRSPVTPNQIALIDDPMIPLAILFVEHKKAITQHAHKFLDIPFLLVIRLPINNTLNSEGKTKMKYTGSKTLGD